MHTAKLKKLQRNIIHENPAVRRKAAEELAQGDERAIYPLIKALRDNNLGVQDAAMRSLMAIRSEATAYMVLPLLRESALLRNTALLILKEMGKIVIPLLYILLDDKDDDIRKFSIDLIHDIKYCNYPEKIVELLTGDPNANVRAAAAKALGAIQYKKAIPGLINALNDDEWVGFSALEALTSMHDDTPVEVILNLLDNSSDIIRIAAVEALGVFRSSKAIDPLVRHIAISKDYENIAAVKSLISIGPVPSMPDIIDALMNILENEDIDGKLIAVRGLASIKHEAAIKQIIDFAGTLDISDPCNEEILLSIRNSLHLFGCSEHILNILHDPSMRFRGKAIAIEIMGDLKCTQAVPMLIDLLSSDYRDVRRSSIDSLGKIESTASKNRLIEAISDHDSHVRKSAVSSIGKIGDMSAFEPLIKMLEYEQYSDVIDEFIIALMRLNHDLFLDRVKDLNNNIQEQASKYAASFREETSC